LKSHLDLVGLEELVVVAAMEADQLGLKTASLILKVARLEICIAEPDDPPLPSKLH
jgi:hypothetical protein